MVGKVIWAAKRLLRRARVSQAKEREFVEFKGRNTRIDLVLARASEAWEDYFAKGGLEDADAIAKSYHAYVCEMLAELKQARRHPDHDRAIKASRVLEDEVRRLRVAAGLPKNEPCDMSNEPSASPELAAARLALEAARIESTRTSRLTKPDVTTEDLKSASYLTKCLYAWAAHVLPEAAFEDFFSGYLEKALPHFHPSQTRPASIRYGEGASEFSTPRDGT